MLIRLAVAMLIGVLLCNILKNHYEKFYSPITGVQYRPYFKTSCKKWGFQNYPHITHPIPQIVVPWNEMDRFVDEVDDKRKQIQSPMVHGNVCPYGKYPYPNLSGCRSLGKSLHVRPY